MGKKIRLEHALEPDPSPLSASPAWSVPDFARAGITEAMYVKSWRRLRRRVGG